MLNFSKPMIMQKNGESVRWICQDVIEYRCARVCVDERTGIIYSGPFKDWKVIQAPLETGTCIGAETDA